ncbi:tRNA (adenosine(37)-N6)-threonylcarbamoyltransferase complex dimerization subunit type 1 TsaB [soil metagenome]
MNILALDTSTQWAAVALARADEEARVATMEPGPRHGRNLLPAIRELLQRAGLAPKELDAVAVGLGPGSYTGLRIGLTAAKALTYATGGTLLAFESLEVIARNAPTTARRVAVIVDAQRGDLYAEDFERSEPEAPLKRRGMVRIETATDWAARQDPEVPVLCPDFDRIARLIPTPANLGTPEQGRPQGLRLLEIAREALEAGQRADPWFLEPIYLRRSAAEENWEARRQVSSSVVDHTTIPLRIALNQEKRDVVWPKTDEDGPTKAP